MPFRHPSDTLTVAFVLAVVAGVLLLAGLLRIALIIWVVAAACFLADVFVGLLRRRRVRGTPHDDSGG
jgi:hypothetical protein